MVGSGWMPLNRRDLVRPRPRGGDRLVPSLSDVSGFANSSFSPDFFVGSAMATSFSDVFGFPGVGSVLSLVAAASAVLSLAEEEGSVPVLAELSSTS